MHDELLDQATGHVPVAGADDTAGSVRLALWGTDYDRVDHLVVLAGPKFVGTVSLRALVAAPPETQLDELMDTSQAVVTFGVDQGGRRDGSESGARIQRRGGGRGRRFEGLVLRASGSISRWRSRSPALELRISTDESWGTSPMPRLTQPNTLGVGPKAR